MMTLLMMNIVRMLLLLLVLLVPVDGNVLIVFG